MPQRSTDSHPDFAALCFVQFKDSYTVPTPGPDCPIDCLSCRYACVDSDMEAWEGYEEMRGADEEEVLVNAHGGCQPTQLSMRRAAIMRR
jgi:hypothetical protein